MHLVRHLSKSGILYKLIFFAGTIANSLCLPLYVGNKLYVFII
jgi:hypothetical protein